MSSSQSDPGSREPSVEAPRGTSRTTIRMSQQRPAAVTHHAHQFLTTEQSWAVDEEGERLKGRRCLRMLCSPDTMVTRAGFKFKVKASKAPPSEQAASFDELVTQAVQPGRRKTRSSARANAPAASVPAARASGRKRKPASPPAATSPSRGKRPRRGQAAADLPAPSASPDSRREARKRAPATASKAPAYAAAPPDSVRLPHARYGNAAALHKLVDAAIDAELRASEVTYGDSHSYILATCTYFVCHWCFLSRGV